MHTLVITNINVSELYMLGLHTNLAYIAITDLDLNGNEYCAHIVTFV